MNEGYYINPYRIPCQRTSGHIHWSVSEYNNNNAWYYNGNNGTLNNNNKYNSNQVRPSLARYYDDDHLLDYPIPYNEFIDYYRKCRQKKRRKASPLIFEHNQVEELITLCHELNMGDYLQRTSIAFIITRPKVREVIAADFRDRVAQTILVQKLLPYMERYLHPDSYACRVKRGGLASARQFRRYVYEVSEGYTVDCWLFSLDIQAFFPSIDTAYWTDKLLEFVDERYEEADISVVKYLIKQIYLYEPQTNCVKMSPDWMWGLLDPAKSMLYGKAPHIGLAIGNVTAQFLALFVTTKVLYRMSEMGVKFVCYTDDIKGVVRDKDKFLRSLPEIRAMFEDECHLHLHPKKFDIQHYSHGIRVGAFKVRFDRLLPNDRVAHNFKFKVGQAIKKANEDEKYIYKHKEDVMAFVNSYLGMLKHCNSYRLRSSQIERLKNSPWSKVFVFSDECLKISIKSKFTERTYYRLKTKECKRKIVSLLAAA